MKDLNQLQQDIEKMKAIIQERIPDIVTLISLSAKAIAERRILDTGFGAHYSNKTVPAWFLEGKTLNKAGETFLKKKAKDDEETNWQELRAAQGLQTGHVDLHYSNAMFSNIAPGEVQESGGVYTAPLTTTNRQARDEMNWNRDRYGDFIGKALTKDDRDSLIKIAMDEIAQILIENGLITK